MVPFVFGKILNFLWWITDKFWAIFHCCKWLSMKQAIWSHWTCYGSEIEQPVSPVSSWKLKLPPRQSSVTRLGEFLKILVTIFLRSVAQIYRRLFGLFWKHQFSSKNCRGHFLGQRLNIHFGLLFISASGHTHFTPRQSFNRKRNTKIRICETCFEILSLIEKTGSFSPLRIAV